MKFQVTKAAISHAIIGTAISIAAFRLGEATNLSSPLLLFAGALFYVSREENDLEKQHKWDFGLWNSAELILPLLCSVVMFCYAQYS